MLLENSRNKYNLYLYLLTLFKDTIEKPENGSTLPFSGFALITIKHVVR